MKKCETANPFLEWLESIDAATKIEIIEVQQRFSRNFFYSNICHVCHRHDNEIPLKKCGNCKMIYYCSREHQKMHWPLHKSFCVNINNSKQISDNLYTYQAQEDLRRRQIATKAHLIYSMETHLKRKLEPYENEMIEYSKVCEVCLEGDSNLLKACPKCPHANFCKNHEGDSAHENFCSRYKSCFDLDYFAVFFQENPIPRMMKFTPRNSEKTRLPNSMQEYLDIFYKPRQDLKLDIPHENVKMYVSQHLTRPLTLIYAMEKIDFKPRKKLIIHVIGASNREKKSMIEWEILFHWLPQLMKLKVMLVGPELSNQDNSVKNGNKLCLCDECTSRGKIAAVETHTTLYKNYCDGKYFTRPDIIIGFNLGLIAYPSWKTSILKVAKLQCPFILTAFSEQEAVDDHNIMYWEFKTNSKVERNRFASLRPKRSPIGDKIFYENQFVAIYNDLSQNNLDKVNNDERRV